MLIADSKPFTYKILKTLKDRGNIFPLLQNSPHVIFIQPHHITVTFLDLQCATFQKLSRDNKEIWILGLQI